jgi:gluconate 2-dehydrogenase gamma chain
MPEETENRDISRRTIIATAALVPVAAITSAAQASDSVFSQTQLRTLTAFADRLVPKDELGPSASECGAIIYIDRALAGPLAAEKTSFLQELDAVNESARKAHGAPLVELAPDKQDEVLAALEKNSRAFFARVRRLTLEGVFSDPYYGGNKGFAGWDLIRYPGPRLAVSQNEQKMRVELKPIHTSAWGNSHGH